MYGCQESKLLELHGITPSFNETPSCCSWWHFSSSKWKHILLLEETEPEQGQAWEWAERSREKEMLVGWGLLHTYVRTHIWTNLCQIQGCAFACTQCSKARWILPGPAWTDGAQGTQELCVGYDHWQQDRKPDSPSPIWPPCRGRAFVKSCTTRQPDMTTFPHCCLWTCHVGKE